MNSIKVLVALLALTFSITSVSGDLPKVDIKYERFVLKNGLTLIVHEDHKAPIVSVGVWYKVGSKDEPEGKSGFAHLFEHLMFNGTENYNGEYFEPFYKVGATDINGTTWLDRTNYFQTVPTPALEMALWMESDRMGHLLGAITQKKLDEQRGVVKNEKRQGENKPYGRLWERMLPGLFPKGHPYHHTTIGSMEDLNAASLKDVKDWFKTYYGAANAVVVLAGDIKAVKAKKLVEKYFGHIPAGPEIKKLTKKLPTRLQRTSEIMYDKAAPQSRLYRVWAVPSRSEKDTTILSLAASLLGGGKNSKLYQELVYKNQMASSAKARVYEFQLASFFVVDVMVKKGVSEEEVESKVDEVIKEFLENKPGSRELERVKTSLTASRIRGLEKIGGWSGKGTVLAQGELYADDPVFFKKQLGWANKASKSDVRKIAKKWLSQGDYQLWTYPLPKFKTIKSQVNRKNGLPKVGAMPELKLPKVQRGKLKNGIQVVLMENPSVPVVNFALQLDVGYSADSAGFKLGTSSFTFEMLDEGTEDRSALEISSEQELLGARITTSSNLDMSVIRLSTLKSKLKDSVELFAEVVKEPQFDQKEMERIRSQWLAGIEQEKASPIKTALRNLPPLLYGKNHAYGIPFTGSGTVESIKSLKRDDLVQFYKAWVRPDNATFFVVGDIKMDDALEVLNREFGRWKTPKVQMLKKNIAAVEPVKKKLIIIDKPGAPQSLILAGKLAPSTKTEKNLDIQMMNQIFGGAFTARLNMNLREDKHWAYGAYSFMRDARGQRPYFVYAPVQTDKTGASIREIQKEIKLFLGKKPASGKELKNAVKNKVNKLPGAYESGAAMLSSLLSNHRFGRPDNYVESLKGKYNQLNLKGVRKAAKEIIQPEQFVWMIIGDRSQIEKQIKGLKLGKKVYMDTSGNLVQ